MVLDDLSTLYIYLQFACPDDIAQLRKHGVDTKVKPIPKQLRIQFSLKLKEKREMEFKNVLAHNFEIFEMLIGYQLQASRRPHDMLNVLVSEVIGNPRALGQNWMIDYEQIDRMAATKGFDSGGGGVQYRSSEHEKPAMSDEELYKTIRTAIGQIHVFCDISVLGTSYRGCSANSIRPNNKKPR